MLWGVGERRTIEDGLGTGVGHLRVGRVDVGVAGVERQSRHRNDRSVDLHAADLALCSAAGDVEEDRARRRIDGLSGGALAVLLLAIGGAVAGVLYAAFHNNDLNFGGSVTVVSPTK